VPRSNQNWSRRISAVNVSKIPFLVRLFIRYSDTRIVVTGAMSSCFLEKLYQYEHPRHVAQFDAVVNEVDFVGYWISRHWVKGTFALRLSERTCSNFSNLDVDWRQLKPKMHVPSQSDPAPDSQFFRDHVMCEHGGLALNISARTRISHKVWQ
jgi:hypothetical protein